ncbi:MAG: SMC-Scp complex subunit ScpB, partial [Pseudomonadota bacterium]
MSDPLTPLNSINTLDTLSPAKIKQILEAVLLAAQDPLPVTELRKLFDNELSATVLGKLLEVRAK